eukprot:1242955-Rhodomonas_salina.2
MDPHSLRNKHNIGYIPGAFDAVTAKPQKREPEVRGRALKPTQSTQPQPSTLAPGWPHLCSDQAAAAAHRGRARGDKTPP